jgi:hypothetical protein
MSTPDFSGRVNFTVYNPTTGEVIRSGYCSRRDLATQARQGEAVIGGTKGHDVSDRVIVPANGAKPYLRRRAAAEVAVRARRELPVDPFAALLEALKAKGIEVSEADLEAGARAVQARRKPDA